jgi:hypothetical protein
MIYLFNFYLQISVDLEVINKTYRAMFTMFSCSTSAFATGYELYGQVYTWALTILCLVQGILPSPCHVAGENRRGCTR